MYPDRIQIIRTLSPSAPESHRICCPCRYRGNDKRPRARADRSSRSSTPSPPVGNRKPSPPHRTLRTCFIRLHGRCGFGAQYRHLPRFRRQLMGRRFTPVSSHAWSCPNGIYCHPRARGDPSLIFGDFGWTPACAGATDTEISSLGKCHWVMSLARRLTTYFFFPSLQP